jgi:hypothetical protein
MLPVPCETRFPLFHSPLSSSLRRLHLDRVDLTMETTSGLSMFTGLTQLRLDMPGACDGWSVPDEDEFSIDVVLIDPAQYEFVPSSVRSVRTCPADRRSRCRLTPPCRRW